MAETKKTTTKTTTKAKTKKETNQPKKQETKATETTPKVEEKKIQPKRQTRKNIDLNAMIPCRSVVVGGLTYISPKTQTQVRWNKFGDIEYVPFGELVTMNAAASRFLREPWLVVDDEEAIIHFGLQKIYDKLIDVDNLEDFFKLALEPMRQKLKIVPDSMKELVSSKAREMVESETLTDIRVIRLLEQELNIDLRILID